VYKKKRQTTTGRDNNTSENLQRFSLSPSVYPATRPTPLDIESFPVTDPGAKPNPEPATIPEPTPDPTQPPVTDLLDDSNATQREQLEEKLKDEKTGDTRLEEFRVTGKLTLGLPYALKDGEAPENVWVDYGDIATTERPAERDRTRRRDGRTHSSSRVLAKLLVRYRTSLSVSIF
jgi:hypothetical protein